MSERTPPPAGWYDDPDMVNTRRYWDGQKWTEHRQEKAASPTPTAVAPSQGRGNLPQWVLVGFGLIVAALALWLVAGNGWATITGKGTTVDIETLQTEVEAGLAEQDAPGFTLTCDDPGEVTKGDVTYCRGKNRRGTPVNIRVTFGNDGAYSWETM